MKWLYRIVSLLYGCRHKWEVIHNIRIFEFDDSSRPCENKLVLKCKKCGKIGSKKL